MVLKVGWHISVCNTHPSTAPDTEQLTLRSLDSEGTFRPERIAEIAERFGVDPEMANDNITVARANNSELQHDLLGDLMENFVTGQYRLLVIDSIVNLFRIDYHGEMLLRHLSARCSPSGYC